MSWGVELADESEYSNTPESIRHVYPLFGREHVLDQREKCWCQPKVELAPGMCIVIHEAEQ